jgi:DNA-binding transcriptional ArsR family regulator
MARWPALQLALLAHATARSSRQGVHQAICNHVRVDARVVGLLWHLAERWGRVTPAGIVLPLHLTHDAIAVMIGAQRPSVSTALASLAERGVVERRPDGAWVLRPDTDEELARIFARHHPARSPDPRLIDERTMLPDRTLEDQIERITSAWEEQIARTMGLRRQSERLAADTRAVHEAMRRLRHERSSENDASR